MEAKRRFQLFYFMYYAAFSGFVAFRNVYLEEIGMTGFQMGLIGFLLTITGVFAQPIWGVITDWKGVQKEILLMGTVATGLAVLSYPLGARTASPFVVIAIGTGLYSIFRAPIVPIANSMILSGGLGYGAIRAFGSIAFGIGSLGYGFLLSGLDTSLIVYAYTAGMVAIVAVLWNMPNPPNDDPTDPGGLLAASKRLLRNGSFVVLLTASLLMGMALSSGSAFLSVYMRAVSAGDAYTGIAWGIKTVGEAAAFVYGLRFDVSLKLLLVVGVLFHTVGHAVLAGTTLPALILAVHVLSGLGYGLFYLGSVNLAHDLAPDALKSTAQTVLAAVGFGAGGAVGQIFAGRLVDLVGVQQMYAYLAGIGVAAAVVCLAVGGWPTSVETVRRIS